MADDLMDRINKRLEKAEQRDKAKGWRHMSFRLRADLGELLEKSADRAGVPYTRMLEEILDFFWAFSPDLWCMLGDVADTNKIQLHELAEALIIRRIADEIAWQDVFGKPNARSFTELRPRRGKRLSGEELYDALYKEARDNYEKAKALAESEGQPLPIFKQEPILDELRWQ